METEATTSTIDVSESKTLTAFHQRIANLEKDVKELKTVDHSVALLSTIKSEVPNAVKEALYHALMESILEDEDVMDKGVADKLKKRKHDDADKDEGPSAGLDRGKSIDFRPPQTWITKIAQAKKPSLSFEELISTHIDFSAYVMNHLNIDKLTQENLVGPTFNLLKGTCKSRVELEYNFEECYKALTN
uniref:Uncharacterized protein n=1 Tax=Tanacetum cinerariifolium TaxID=118510 RepID=A0A699H6Z9_TANCI|nr:hypothetical protein [Tanacetum cinerariifolium]